MERTRQYLAAAHADLRECYALGPADLARLAAALAGVAEGGQGKVGRITCTHGKRPIYYWVKARIVLDALLALGLDAGPAGSGTGTGTGPAVGALEVCRAMYNVALSDPDGQLAHAELAHV